MRLRWPVEWYCDNGGCSYKATGIRAALGAMVNDECPAHSAGLHHLRKKHVIDRRGGR